MALVNRSHLVKSDADQSRSAKRFAYQEEGRGVVRRWAEWAIDVDVDVNVEDDPDAGRSTSTSR